MMVAMTQWPTLTHYTKFDFAIQNLPVFKKYFKEEN
jgi:hypothetical protein